MEQLSRLGRKFSQHMQLDSLHLRTRITSFLGQVAPAQSHGGKLYISSSVVSFWW